MFIDSLHCFVGHDSKSEPPIRQGVVYLLHVESVIPFFHCIQIFIPRHQALQCMSLSYPSQGGRIWKVTLN